MIFFMKGCEISCKGKSSLKSIQLSKKFLNLLVDRTPITKLFFMTRKLLWMTILAFVVSPVIAQSYVTLYQDCNFRGISATLEVGNYRTYQMKIGNDKLSSLSIPNGMKVTIYEHDNYSGRSTTFTSSITCMDGSWNDMTSSIVVERTYQGGRNQNDYVVIYKDCYSRGYSRTLTPGTYSGNDLGLLRNAISSFSISGNLRIKVYTNNDNASGYNTIYEESQSCLPGSINDKIKSLVIERRGRWNNNGDNGDWNNNNNNNNNYATIYTDCNYQGSSLRLAPGNYRGDQLGLLKYDVSSIKLPSNLRAKVYINNEYLMGNYYMLNESTSCLSYSLNNKIGSLVIENTGYNNNDNYNYPPDNEQRVIIYSDGDYRGQAVSLLPGTYSSMTQLGFPDNALSSLILPTGFRVVLYDRENFQGSSYQVNQSKTGFLISGWNDKTSSIAVYRDY